jgi:hypothetical protein
VCQRPFQRGVQALTQYVAREGLHRVPRTHPEQITVEGHTAPLIVKLGVWVSNARSRHDTLTQEQSTALAEPGGEWPGTR